jgi:hypothetical protein
MTATVKGGIFKSTSRASPPAKVRAAGGTSTSSVTSRPVFPDKRLKNSILQLVAEEVEGERYRAEQQGEGIRGIKQRVVENHQRWCPWLTINVLDYYLRRTKTKTSSTRPTSNKNIVTVSTQQQQRHPTAATTTRPPPPPLESITVSEDASDEYSVLSGSWAYLVETDIGTMIKKANGKNGSGDEDRDEFARRITEALEYATIEFAKLKKEVGKGKGPRRGAYDEIILSAHLKFSLPPDVKLRKETLVARARKVLQLSTVTP